MDRNQDGDYARQRNQTKNDGQVRGKNPIWRKVVYNIIHDTGKVVRWNPARHRSYGKISLRTKVRKSGAGDISVRKGRWQ